MLPFMGIVGNSLYLLAADLVLDTIHNLFLIICISHPIF